MGKLLIIDDEPVIRKLLARMMELEGHEVVQASDCASGLRAVERERPQVVLCDVYLPDGNGLDLITAIKKITPEAEVIMLTAHGNIADGVQAIKNGAFDYITKGDDNNKIVPIVSRAMETTESREKPQAAAGVRSFDTIIGHSPALCRTIGMAQKVAATEVSVLLTGETGTGKEVFAQAIHRAGPRGAGPFVAVNCAAFSRELLESELFGHKAGAFTGALKDKKGLFEEADHGTLFLDEVGEMAFELQAKLLRVLETGEYISIGATKPTKVDVRIISATNRNLKTAIERNLFREDLYFRLSVFHIELPPLRERPEDIRELAEHFRLCLARKMKKPATGFAPETLRRMEAYAWPGNVRELRNVVERALIVCDGDIKPEDLPAELQTAAPEERSGHNEFELAEMERRHIIRVLRHTEGNKTEAARLLKIGLTTLYRKIEEYGIRPME